MAVKILVCGLPGSGKTFLATALKKYLEENGTISDVSQYRAIMTDPISANYRVLVDWFNADEIRKRFDDWDFSREGRIRQSLRMAEFALKSPADYVIADFVAPLKEMRDIFDADWLIWVNTISLGRFEDTNKIFEPPDRYNFCVTTQDAEWWASFIVEKIINSHNIR